MGDETPKKLTPEERQAVLLEVLRSARSSKAQVQKLTEQLGPGRSLGVIVSWMLPVVDCLLELLFLELGEEPPEVEDKPIIYIPSGPGGGIRGH